MRSFKLDGQNWIAQIHDGKEASLGWEVIQFDTEPGGSTQKISFRPAGWLGNASIQELIDALKEGDSVRASW